MKKMILAIAVCMALTLCACTNTATTADKETSTGTSAESEVSSTDTGSDTVTSDTETPSSNGAFETVSDTASDTTAASTPNEDKPQSQTPPKAETSVPPASTSKPAEQSKPAEPSEPPAPSEPEPSQPAVQYATAADAEAIADKIVEYINSYRSSPAIKLPGLTKYAEYRSRQLVSNFAHDTNDERTAATALKYGEYVIPSEWGMTGEPYYTANAGEAIGKAGYRGTIDYVAQKFADGFRNSSGHWAYVGDSKYAYIAVGVTYESGMWYCDVAVALENSDNL